jgi:hypothetical protein
MYGSNRNNKGKTEKNKTPDKAIFNPKAKLT